MKKYCLSFLAGFIAAFVMLIILAATNVLPESKNVLLLKKWHLTEPNDNMILIDVFPDHFEPLTVGVEKSHTSNQYRIGLVTNKDKHRSTSFSYITKWKYGKPAVFYGDKNHHGFIWRDLNADGIFDQRVSWNDDLIQINLEDHWVECKKIDDNTVLANEREYIFDPNEGTWISKKE